MTKNNKRRLVIYSNMPLSSGVSYQWTGSMQHSKSYKKVKSVNIEK